MRAILAIFGFEHTSNGKVLIRENLAAALRSFGLRCSSKQIQIVPAYRSSSGSLQANRCRRGNGVLHVIPAPDRR